MRALLLCVGAAALSPLSPAAMLRQWRAERASATAELIDPSRYHLQLLFVDDDNARGRVAEGVLEAVAEWADAGWWLYPFSATLGDDDDAQPDAAPLPWAPAPLAAPDAAIEVMEELGLCSTRARAAGAEIALEDLDSHDLVVCLDFEVRDRLMRRIPAADRSLYEAKVRCLSDFASVELGEEPSEEEVARTGGVIPPRLAARAAPFRDALARDGAFDALRAAPAPRERALALTDAGAAALAPAGSWRHSEAALVYACAGLTRFCKATIDDGFVACYERLLGACFCRREHLDVAWEDAETIVRRHVFTGVFTPEERRARFEQHIAELRGRLDRGGEGGGGG